MAKKATQSAKGMNYSVVALEKIQPSQFNPRKQFDEESLKELAESINQQGVLQPINIRPIADTDNYEIVFGERRYRASILAGKETIPAIINNYTDEEAEEIAITENLQRKDVSPMEEARAYVKLLERGNHDVKSLAILFGKSEVYIRSRMKFSSLIPEMAELMEKEEISLGVANEICKYSEEIQEDIYDKYFNGGTYQSWRGKKASEIANYIQINYTTNLESYSFDKEMCANCQFNTNQFLLFNDGGCGKCTNRQCLNDKIATYMIDKIVKAVEDNPMLHVCTNKFNTNDSVAKKLEEMGFEIEDKLYINKLPSAPTTVNREAFEDEEEYNEKLEEFKESQEQYENDCQDIKRMCENGNAKYYIVFGVTNVWLGYAKVDDESQEDGKKPSPVEAIKKKDERNKEISIEKTIADTKRKILEVEINDRDFSIEEEKMMYYFMLPTLRTENYSKVGLGNDVYWLSDENKIKIIENLTETTKAIIRRDFLVNNLQSAYRGNFVAKMLKDFATIHMAQELKAIEDTHNDVYEKRHQRLEEKKAKLMENNS